MMCAKLPTELAALARDGLYALEHAWRTAIFITSALCSSGASTSRCRRSTSRQGSRTQATTSPSRPSATRRSATSLRASGRPRESRHQDASSSSNQAQDDLEFAGIETRHAAFAAHGPQSEHDDLADLFRRAGFAGVALLWLDNGDDRDSDDDLRPLSSAAAPRSLLIEGSTIDRSRQSDDDDDGGIRPSPSTTTARPPTAGDSTLALPRFLDDVAPRLLLSASEARSLLIDESTPAPLHFLLGDGYAGVVLAQHEPSPHHDLVVMHVSQSRPPAIQIIVDTGATVTVVRDLQRLGATSIVDCSLRLVGIAPTRAQRKGVLTLFVGSRRVILAAVEIQDVPIDLISASALCDALPAGSLTFMHDSLVIDTGHERAWFKKSDDGIVRLTLDGDRHLAAFSDDVHFHQEGQGYAFMAGGKRCGECTGCVEFIADEKRDYCHSADGAPRCPRCAQTYLEPGEINLDYKARGACKTHFCSNRAFGSSIKASRQEDDNSSDAPIAKRRALDKPAFC
jgi:hypothetical protein